MDEHFAPTLPQKIACTAFSVVLLDTHIQTHTCSHTHTDAQTYLLHTFLAAN